MSDVNHMENRLRAALSRMEDAVTKLPDPSAVIASEQQRTELAAQLQAERESNAELEKRVEALQEVQQSRVTDLENALSAAKTSLAEKDAVQQELKTRLEELRDQVARLTEANRAMVGDAGLVNTAMMAEVEAMRASRRADVSDIDDLIASLNAQMEGDSHA